MRQSKSHIAPSVRKTENTNMRKYRLVVIIFAIILIVIGLIDLDYNDLSWTNCKGTYFGIIAMLFTITAMIVSNWDDKRNANKN